MKHFIFKLSMPGRGSWNGRWTGSEFIYARLRSCYAKEIKDLKFKNGDNFGYDFGDGWFASIEVKQLSLAEARKVMKNSKGFCGYDWMIDSIVKYGEIRKPIREIN